MKSSNADFEIRFFEGLIKRSPDYVHALIPLAESYSRKGLFEKGLQIDRHLAKLCPKDPIVHYNLACSFGLVGHKEDALKVLKESIRLGYTDFEHMKKDKDLKILHEDPEFQALMRPGDSPAKK